MGNFDTISRNKNSYFHHQDEYQQEKMMYKLCVNEAYNLHGVCITYFATSYNTNYNTVFGEDADRKVERYFNVMSFFELPKEQEMFTKYGIQGIDNFHIYVSIRHFNTASMYGNEDQPFVNSSMTPKIGDIIFSKYNSYLYEIVSVKDTVMQFLQDQHTWDIIVSPYKDFGISSTLSTSAIGMNLIMNQVDIMDIINFINSKKNEVLYTSAICETPPSNINGVW